MWLRLTALIFIAVMGTQLFGETIRSTTGSVDIDVNEDGVSEAKVNNTGLAIGTNLTPSSNLHVGGNIVITRELLLGSSTGKSNLEVGGSFGFSMQTITSDTTLSDNTVILADSPSDNININLPPVAQVAGRHYIIKKTSANNHVLIGGSDNLIDNYSGYKMTSGNLGFIQVISNGISWDIQTKSESVIKDGEWTPELISTFVWLDANDASTITHSDNSVSQWDDKSGNNRHGTQATTEKQPLTSANTIGGLNAISFVHQDFLNLPDGSFPTGNSKYAFFLVANITKRTANFNMIMGSLQSGSYNMLMMLNSSSVFYSWWNSGGADDFNFGVAPTENADTIIVTDYDQSQRSLYLNGTLSGSQGGTTSRNSGSTLNYIGSDDSLNWAVMRVGEIIVLDNAPTDFERERIEGYLAHKWGLVSSLPVNHTFKTEAP